MTITPRFPAISRNSAPALVSALASSLKASYRGKATSNRPSSSVSIPPVDAQRRCDRSSCLVGRPRCLCSLPPPAGRFSSHKAAYTPYPHFDAHYSCAERFIDFSRGRQHGFRKRLRSLVQDQGAAQRHALLPFFAVSDCRHGPKASTRFFALRLSPNRTEKRRQCTRRRFVTGRPIVH